jgi:hypothetical protein
MRISFNIDDTLVCGPAVPSEVLLPCWKRWLYPESTRGGTRELLSALIAQRHEIWIYTTWINPRSASHAIWQVIGNSTARASATRLLFGMGSTGFGLVHGRPDDSMGFGLALTWLNTEPQAGHVLFRNVNQNGPKN